MVMRNDLSAMVGKANRRSTDPASEIPVVDNGLAGLTVVRTSRVMRGVLPSNTSMGMSTGVADNSGSSTRSRPSPVISPTTATGHRSRAHSAANIASVPGTRAST